jgi:tetratricopeptide (TPR) repeat protein
MRKIFVILLFFVGCVSEDKGLLKEEALNYHKLGRIAQKNQDLITAISYYKKASYIDPYNPTIHNDLGIAYEQKGWYKLAEIEFKKALEIDKFFLPAYYNLARIYEKQGKIEEAIEYYKLRIKFAKGEDDPWVWKAQKKIFLLEQKLESHEK